MELGRCFLSVICEPFFSWAFSFSERSRQIVSFTCFSCQKHGNWKVLAKKVCGCIKNFYTNFPQTNQTNQQQPPSKTKKKEPKAKTELPKNLRTKQQQQKSLPHNMSFNRSKLWALVKGVPCAESSCLWKMAVLWWTVSLVKLKVFASKGC